MTIEVDLPSGIEQAYIAAAEARGLPLAAIMREALMAAQPAVGARELTPEEWVRQFRIWTQSHASENLPLLSDEDISRENIYRERGL